MNESEQAQAIAEIKERVIDCPKANQMDLEDIAFSKLDREKLLEIVDSQAQKIAASATVIEEMHAHTVTLNALYLQAEEDIAALNDMVEADHRVMAEQAKEIERLKGSQPKISALKDGSNIG